MRWQLSRHLKHMRADTTQVFGARAAQAGNQAMAESQSPRDLLENS